MIISRSSAAVRSVAASADCCGTSSCHQWSRPGVQGVIGQAGALDDDHVPDAGHLGHGLVGDSLHGHFLAAAEQPSAVNSALASASASRATMAPAP